MHYSDPRLATASATPVWKQQKPYLSLPPPNQFRAGTNSPAGTAPTNFPHHLYPHTTSPVNNNFLQHQQRQQSLRNATATALFQATQQHHHPRHQQLRANAAASATLSTQQTPFLPPSPYQQHYHSPTYATAPPPPVLDRSSQMLQMANKLLANAGLNSERVCFFVISHLYCSHKLPNFVFTPSEVLRKIAKKQSNNSFFFFFKTFLTLSATRKPSGWPEVPPPGKTWDNSTFC